LIGDEALKRRNRRGDVRRRVLKVYANLQHASDMKAGRR